MTNKTATKPNWVLTKLKELFVREKELSLDERLSRVCHDFYERFPMPQFYDASGSSPFVVEVFDTYLIATQGDDYYRVPYTEADGEFTFTDPVDWLEVENTWVDMPVSEKEAKNSVAIFKQADGKYRWTIVSSSAYKDRDGEIASLKAHEEDIARMDASGDYGVLRWWHVGKYGPAVEGGDWTTFKAFEGADLGVCDFAAMHGKMRVESGTFYDNDVAESFKDHADALGVSIGFSHPITQPDAAKVLNDIHTFERSFLPKESASNLYTSVPVIEKEYHMEDKKESKLKELAGAEQTARILGKAATTEKSADAAGVQFKEGEPQGDTRKIGDMTQAEFGAYLGNAFATFSAQAQAATAEKEVKTETKLNEIGVALKATTDKTDHVLAQVATMQTSLKSAQDAISILAGDLPNSVRNGFRASQSTTTVTEKAKELAEQTGVTQKGAGEQTMDSFMNFMLKPANA